METIEVKRRILIEGGFQDDWSRLHSVHPMELLIPTIATRVNIRNIGSTLVTPLDLVYRWIDQYLIPAAALADPMDQVPHEFNLFDYDGVQAVASIITADGRIYFDTKLTQDRSENNRMRLSRFLRVLIRNSADMTNPVNLFFTMEGRQKFQGTPIEIINPPK